MEIYVKIITCCACDPSMHWDMLQSNKKAYFYKIFMIHIYLLKFHFFIFAMMDTKSNLIEGHVLKVNVALYPS